MIDGLAVRITLPFKDVSGIVYAWALKAEKLVVYEHIGEATAKPHVHMLMLGVGCDKERLKQIAKPWVPFGAQGNEFWSFKTKCKGLGPIDANNSRRYVVYMTKGNIDPSYNKGFDADWLQTCKESWAVKEAEPNRNEKLFDLFEEFLYNYYQDAAEREVEFQPCSYLLSPNHIEVLGVRLARKWAFQYHKSIWSIRTATDAKMVYLTYCMRYNFTIPQSIKTW